MNSDERCERARLELSTAHDEHRSPSRAVADHVAECDACNAFDRGLADLDRLLAAGAVHRSPDIAASVMARVGKRHRQWWSVAAVAAVGVLVGAVVGGIGSRLDVVQAQDLGDRFHAASPDVLGLSAKLLVVERGWHPDVFERVYVGTLEYSAPEELAIELTDTTIYPDDTWTPNDVRLQISNGDTVTVASSRCPVAALPGCQKPPSKMAVRDQRPFEDGVLVPLEIVSPARSLTWWSGMDVVGSPMLGDRSTIQVETTVAAADMIRAITERGAWRELHPTDRVLMWLDSATLVPVRIEVFSAQSPERQLWQLRRGYVDGGSEPIFIIELAALTAGPVTVELAVPNEAQSGGFVDGPASVPEPVLEPGFIRHRSGHWPLPDGGKVDVATWSDGRSWIMVEATDAWTGSQLFGASVPFVRQIELGSRSVGYVNLNGDAIAIHTADIDVLVSGSVPHDVLVSAAASLQLPGVTVPDNWAEAAVVEVDRLPEGALVPDIDGWSMLGISDGDRITVVMIGGGSRTVVVTSEPGVRLDPPPGADFAAIEVRGTLGRFDTATATLEWVEAGRILRMRSETVGLGELLELAATLVSP